MSHDIEPLDQALDGATGGNQVDIYSLLASWNTSMETALEQSGDRFRDVFWKYL